LGNILWAKFLDLSNMMNISKLSFLRDKGNDLINAIHLPCVRKWCIKIHLLYRNELFMHRSIAKIIACFTKVTYTYFMLVLIFWWGVELINYCWTILGHYILKIQFFDFEEYWVLVNFYFWKFRILDEDYYYLKKF
jgi:hypothetical protein